MKLNNAGICIWSSDALFQGAPDGSSVVLNPLYGDRAGWFTQDMPGRHVPDDYANPKLWQIETAAGQKLLGDFAFNRVGGGIAAGSGQSDGQIRWPDGTVQPFDGRIVGISDSGVVLTTDGDHRSLSCHGSPTAVRTLVAGGVLQMSDAQYSDQFDAQLVNGWLSLRMDVTTHLYRFDTMTPVADFLPNPAARTTIPMSDGSLVEWGLDRVTWRPHDSALGLVLLESGSSFYLDAVKSGDDLVLVYSAGQQERREDYRAILTRNYESLPRVDVLTPPLVPALPMPVAPLPPLTNLWYFAYHHADWNQPGGPFPDIDTALRCDAIYGLSDDEIRYALQLGKPCIITLDQAQHFATLLHHAGLLWAFVARNENGADLQAQVDALEPLCVQYDRPMVVYNDGGMEKWPTRWPRYAVASVKCYFEAYEPIDQWRSRSRSIIQQFQSVFQAVPIDICYSAFDRNVASWTPNTLSNLQVVTSELAREFA